MPKRVPKGLKVYTFHGVEIEEGEGDEAMGVCPFCGAEGKFSVNLETTLFKCWKCDENGNSVTFLRKFWDLCKEETSEGDYRKFAKECGIESSNPLKIMGCALSTIKQQWIVPGYNIEGNITGLYRFGRIKDKSRWVNRLLISPGGGTHLLNLQNVKGTKQIYLTEGWRDALAWMEVTRDDVVSLTGAGVFKPFYCPVFANKDVAILFDANDAGEEGVKKTASMLKSSQSPPASVSYLAWENVKEGADVRDYLQGKARSK